MNIITKSSILQGDIDKAFNIALTEMKNYYSKETAKNFYDVYKNASLSFIISHYMDIIQEAYYGTDFIKNILKKSIYPTFWMRDIIYYIKDTIRESKLKLSPLDQINKYEELLKICEERREMMQGTFSIQSAAECVYKDFICIYFDLIYYAELNSDKDTFYETIDVLYSIKSPHLFYAIAPLLLSKYPDETSEIIYEVTKKFYSPYTENMEDSKLKNTLMSISCLNRLSKDEYVISALNVCYNRNLSNLWKQIMVEHVKDIDAKRALMDDCRDEKTSEEDILYHTHDEGSLFEDNVFVKQDNDIKLYDNLNHKKIILEHVLESSELFDDLSLNKEQEETCIQELADTEYEMLALEWEDDGEPNAVIKTHIQTRKEKEKEIEDKENDKAKKEVPTTNDKSDNNDDTDDEISDDNIEYRKNLYDTVSDAVKTVDGCSIHITSSDLDKFKNGETNSLSLGSFKQDDYLNVYKAVKDAIYSDDNVKVIKDNYNTMYVDIVKGSDYFSESCTGKYILASRYSMLYEVTDEDQFKSNKATSNNDSEDSKNDNNESKDNSNTNPQKPKTDIYTKIQNKALDHDVKRKQKEAERKEKLTKLKNAAKAATSGQRNDLKKEQDFTKEIDKWDDNRRKKFLLKPGFRHRIFKNLKLAILYGSAAQVKLFYVPVVMVLRHFSKDKDMRIKNELIRELDTEIHICEEKINDANSNGDQQEKYRLMRIKAKLDAEKNRVTVNSKFI
jgi:hypothetical protein